MGRKRHLRLVASFTTAAASGQGRQTGFSAAQSSTAMFLRHFLPPFSSPPTTVATCSATKTVMTRFLSAAKNALALRKTTLRPIGKRSGVFCRRPVKQGRALRPPDGRGRGAARRLGARWADGAGGPEGGFGCPQRGEEVVGLNEGRCLW